MEQPHSSVMAGQSNSTALFFSAQHRRLHDLIVYLSLLILFFALIFYILKLFIDTVLSYLPTPRSQSYDPLLASTAVQEMRDSHSHYYFQIEAVRREGEPIPPERLRGIIRRILFNQRQGEIIRRHEEELSARATENGEVKIFDDERAKREDN